MLALHPAQIYIVFHNMIFLENLLSPWLCKFLRTKNSPVKACTWPEWYFFKNVCICPMDPQKTGKKMLE